MNEGLMRQLAEELSAELSVHLESHPRTFHAGLVAAQIAATTLSRAFTNDSLQLTPEVLAAIKDLEAALEPGQGTPELNRARDLFMRFRGPLLHFDYTQVSTANLNRHALWAAYGTTESNPAQLSRRTRCVTDLALRLLTPIDRQRYREEWSAELADLPRRDQAPYAFRLLLRSWSLRRELNQKPSRAPNVGLVVMATVPGADALVALYGLDWPAAIVGVGWTVGLAWIVSSKERTQHLIRLIREFRRW
jgi:hypothetical protein